MKVIELLNLPSLAGLRLLAGSGGVSRTVSTVTVVDTPDGAQWLRGEEVVITTGYAFREDPQGLKHFVTDLHRRRVSALAVKMGRYIPDIPQEILDLANRLDFPLLDCPESYAFSDVINPVLNNIIDYQSLLMQQKATIHGRFMELAVNETRLEEILTQLSQVIARPAAFLDGLTNTWYFSDATSLLATQLEGQTLAQLLESPSAELLYYKVGNQKQTYGYILTDRLSHVSLDNSISQTAMEYASIVITLQMQMNLSGAMAEEKYRASLVSDLLLNNVKTQSEIYTRSQLYGWDLTRGGFVVIVDINNIKKRYIKEEEARANSGALEYYTEFIFSAARKRMAQYFPRELHYAQSDYISFLIPNENPANEETYGRLEGAFQALRQEIAHKVPFTVSMGVGEYCPDIQDIYQSYEQAKSTMKITYQMERFDGIYQYSHMGVYRLFTPLLGTQEAQDFYHTYLAPVVAYDQGKNGDLLLSLQCFVDKGWNLKLAAEALFIHYNSAKYRFQKLCDLLEVNLRDPEQQFAMEVALKLMALKKYVN